MGGKFVVIREAYMFATVVHPKDEHAREKIRKKLKLFIPKKKSKQVPGPGATVLKAILAR